MDKTNVCIVFKEVWNKADLEPQAQTHYIEMKEMVKQSLKFNQRDLVNRACLLTFSLMKWLAPEPIEDSRDIHKAVAKLSPFFYSEFLESSDGQIFKESLLFKQEERSKNLPDIRSHVGNRHRPKEFWKEWDGVKKNMTSLDDVPAEWDVIVRPIIARCKLMLIVPVTIQRLKLTQLLT